MSTPWLDEGCRRETVNWRRRAQHRRTHVSQSVGSSGERELEV
jgi:hypothetical protein